MIYQKHDNHAFIKKIFYILLIFSLILSTTLPKQVDAAFSKPLTITAKKVAKELAENSAVQMAEHILFEKAMKDFLETDLTDDGYKAVCLDGSKSFNDCSPNKRAQVKEKITSTDKAKLSNRVEQVLEQKTNTSSKWTKFLDWFVPIFLISGLVATFESIMDSDSESLIDDIAQQALLDTGLLKSLNNVKEETMFPIHDFTNFISDVSVKNDGYLNMNISFEITMLPGKALTYKLGEKNYILDKSQTLTVVYSVGQEYYGSGSLYWPVIKTIAFLNTQRISIEKQVYKSSEGFGTRVDAEDFSRSVFDTQLVRLATIQTDVNSKMSVMMHLVNMGSLPLSFNVPLYEPVPVKTDFGTQIGTQYIKNLDGTVTTPGIEQFTYTYNNTYIYPTPDSTTGWKDKTTGQDAIVVEDDIIVDSKTDTIPDDTKTPEKTDLDQLGTNLPKELIFALLDMLRSILYYMVRLATFVLSIPRIPIQMIPYESLQWFFNVEIVGIQIMTVFRSLALAGMSLGIFKILKKVF